MRAFFSGEAARWLLGLPGMLHWTKGQCREGLLGPTGDCGVILNDTHFSYTCDTPAWGRLCCSFAVSLLN